METISTIFAWLVANRVPFSAALVTLFAALALVFSALVTIFLPIPGDFPENWFMKISNVFKKIADFLSNFSAK